MKNIAVMLAFCVFATIAPKPTLAEDENHERIFFPKHSVRGYGEFGFSFPHNEPDLGRCVGAGSLAHGGAHDQCTAFARYMGSGYVEFQPFGRGNLRRLFFFIEPRFFFGKTVPQRQYTFSAEPIAMERTVGVGIELPRNFELRWSQHSVQYFGKYNGTLGPSDIGARGPLGLYSSVSIRWNFGGWGREH